MNFLLNYNFLSRQIHNYGRNVIRTGAIWLACLMVSNCANAQEKVPHDGNSRLSSRSYTTFRSVHGLTNSPTPRDNDNRYGGIDVKADIIENDGKLALTRVREVTCLPSLHYSGEKCVTVGKNILFLQPL